MIDILFLVLIEWICSAFFSVTIFKSCVGLVLSCLQHLNLSHIAVICPEVHSQSELGRRYLHLQTLKPLLLLFKIPQWDSNWLHIKLKLCSIVPNAKYCQCETTPWEVTSHPFSPEQLAAEIVTHSWFLFLLLIHFLQQLQSTPNAILISMLMLTSSRACTRKEKIC